MKNTNTNTMESLFKRSSYAQRMIIGLMLATGVAAGASCMVAPDQAMASTMLPQNDSITQEAGDPVEQAEEAVSGLGEFADYGLVGFEQTTLNCHTNSNIATDTLQANGQTFGTNNVAEAEQSLIAHTDAGMTQITTANGSTVLIGPDNEVTNADCPQAMMVNGSKVTCNGGTAGTLRQAAEDEFPEFESWREDACETSRALAELQDNVTYDDRDMNRRTVYASESGISVVSVDAATLSKYNTEVHLRGVDDGTVVVNIDTLGMDSLTLPSVIVNDENNRERMNWSAYNAVLNIFDSSSNDSMFHGDVTFTGRVIGIILAPYANVVAPHNVDGQIIATNITIRGEFHRDSYTGPVVEDELSDEPEVPVYPTITMVKMLRSTPPMLTTIIDEPEPEMPAEPETPEAPETPETPETPGTPEVPETPETPDAPETPETPETPKTPEVPETPEIPETPETPEVPETPEQPEVPEVPEAPADADTIDGEDASDAPKVFLTLTNTRDKNDLELSDDLPNDNETDEGTLHEEGEADSATNETPNNEAKETPAGSENDVTNEMNDESNSESSNEVTDESDGKSNNETGAEEKTIEQKPVETQDEELPQVTSAEIIEEGSPTDMTTKATPAESDSVDDAIETANDNTVKTPFASYADANNEGTSSMPKTGDIPMTAYAGFGALASALAAAFARLRIRREDER